MIEDTRTSQIHQLIFEGAILALFSISLSLVFFSIIGGEIFSTLNIFVFLFSGIYMSTFALYATIERPNSHLGWLLVGKGLILMLTGFGFGLSLGQHIILLMFTVIYLSMLLVFMRIMVRETQNTILYYPRRIIFPYIDIPILGFLVLISLFACFRLIQVNQNSSSLLVIPEEILVSQSSLITPILQQFEPLYTENISVRQLISQQVEQGVLESNNLEVPEGTELIDVPESVKNQVVSNEILKLEEQYQINIDPDSPFLKVIVQGLNQRIQDTLGPYLTPVFEAIIISLFLLLGLAFLIPFYQVLIKLTIAALSKILISLRVIILEDVMVTKHTIRL